LAAAALFLFLCALSSAVESRCVLARENRGVFLAVYTARVRISVQADGSTIIREGRGRGASPG